MHMAGNIHLIYDHIEMFFFRKSAVNYQAHRCTFISCLIYFKPGPDSYSTRNRTAAQNGIGKTTLSLHTRRIYIFPTIWSFNNFKIQINFVHTIHRSALSVCNHEYYLCCFFKSWALNINMRSVATVYFHVCPRAAQCGINISTVTW